MSGDVVNAWDLTCVRWVQVYRATGQVTQHGDPVYRADADSPTPPTTQPRTPAGSTEEATS